MFCSNRAQAAYELRQDDIVGISISISMYPVIDTFVLRGEGCQEGKIQMASWMIIRKLE